MDSSSAAALGGFSLVIGLFLVVLGILWFCLPFAVFGLKAKLDALTKETQRTNALLGQVYGELAATSAARETDTPSRQ
jgi:ABC-type spermidine/putrescine transport system permease subunit I